MTSTLTILVMLAQVTAAEPVVATGTVLDVSGRPAGGAEIVLADGPPTTPAYFRASVWTARPAAVLNRRACDAEGRFTVELPDYGELTEWMRRPSVLWAFDRGALGLRQISVFWPKSGAPIQVKMVRSEPVRLVLLNPDGQPVEGARLAPARIRGIWLPFDLGERLAAQTDANGRATIAAGSADELEVIRATSRPFGVQHLRIPRFDAAETRTLKLLPAGRVQGRIRAEDPRAVRGLSVRIATAIGASARADGTGGSAETVTNNDGRFWVPAIAIGELTVTHQLRRELPLRNGPPDWPAVREGEFTEVEVFLKKAVRVSGVVNETGTGKPIPGAGVSVGWQPEPLVLSTDAQGRFTDYVLPGVFAPSVVDIPHGYYFPDFFLDSQVVATGAADVTLKPLQLAKSGAVKGKVIDASGRPAAGAEVSGYWLRPSRGYDSVAAVADREGAFVIEGVHPQIEVRLSARRGIATTAEPQPAWSDKGPVTLQISPENATAIEGRAVGPKGGSLVNASVRISGRKRGPENFEVEPPRIVAFDDDGHSWFRTDADGRFRTPRCLRPDLEYRAEIEAEGQVSAHTAWIQPTKVKTFPDVVLWPIAQTRVVEGRVLDKTGRPVVGAAVIQAGDGPLRTRATTSAEGRFRLPGVFREPAYLFVAHDGFRFEGHPIAAAEEPIVLTASRTGDPPAPPMRTLAPIQSRDQEKALALRLIADDLARIRGKEVTSDMIALMEIVPRVDPSLALDLAEKGALPEAIFNDFLRLITALGLLEASPEEATAVAETLKNPALHSRFYREASDRIPKGERSRRLELLDKALLQTRAEGDPANRLDELGMIGYRLIDMGETKRGTEVLKEGYRLAGTLPKPDASNRKSPAAHARGRFAAKLARIDTQAAFTLADGFTVPYDNWYLGGVALGLAERDPAESERALTMMSYQHLRDMRTVRVVGRMAVHDRPRALRLARSLEDPNQRVSALGAIARGLADSDPKAASSLTEEAYGILLKRAEQGRDRSSSGTSCCIVGAELMSIAERLDSELLRRSFWTTVALRPLRPSEADPVGDYEQVIAQLACALARYDRAVARQVLEPVTRRARSLDDGRRGGGAHTLFVAAAVINPAWAVALVDALPHDSTGASLRPRAMAARAVADVLARAPDERWEYLASRYLWGQGDSKDDER
jgi:hypothetical protein